MIPPLVQGTRFLIQHPRTMAGVFILVLIQVAIITWLATTAEAISLIGNIGDWWAALSLIEQGTLFVALFASMMIGLHIWAYVGGMVKSVRSKHVPVSIGKSAQLSAWLMVIAFGIWSLVTLVDVFLLQGGLLSLVGQALLVVGGIALAVASIKLVFTPVLLGSGLTLKKALQKSWEYTKKKFWHTVGLIIVLLVIQTLLWNALDFVNAIDSDILFTLAAALIHTVWIAWAASVLSHAIMNAKEGVRA